MTWQRIDENTYIDDSLVTCAEYQLFIDETRVQGKYYQPDHWNSYQFSKGQAREPILGVRRYDAIALCEWVTNREGEGWAYRLPNKKEIALFPLFNKNPGGKPFGYWGNEKPNFFWARPFIKSILRVDLLTESAERFNLTFNKDINARLEFINTIKRYSQYFVQARDFIRGMDRSLMCKNAINRARNRSIEINRNRDRFHNLYVDLWQERDHAIAKITDPAPNINSSSTQDHGYQSFLVTGINLAIDNYLDIFTLQERVSGAYPAFEGIRLVKERGK